MTFDQFRDTIANYRLPRVLLTALELSLFTTIGDGHGRCRRSPKKPNSASVGLSILCRNLAMSGLLQKRADSYTNSRLAATALNAGHAAYRGGYLDLIKSHWIDGSRLPESVRSGLPIDHVCRIARITAAVYLGHASPDLETAPSIAAQVNLRAATDLPGSWRRARDLCDGVPCRESEASCDGLRSRGRPGGGQRNCRRASTGRRLSYLPLDFSKDSIPGTYDVIWYSNVLHILFPADNMAIFRRARAAMNPGGRLIIQDAFCIPEGLFPAEASLFAVSMLLLQNRGIPIGGRDDFVVEESRLSADQTAEVSQRRRIGRTGSWRRGRLEAVQERLSPKTIKRKFKNPLIPLNISGGKRSVSFVRI